MSAPWLKGPAILRDTKLLVAAAVALFVVVFAALVLANIRVTRGYFVDLKQRRTLEQRFAQLSARHTNHCALARVDADTRLPGRLQGSCCSPMDYDRYADQIVGLRPYAHTSARSRPIRMTYRQRSHGA